MHTDRWEFRGERRRRKALVSPPFLSRGGEKEGREGKQDKGSVSRHRLSDCLHILFLRDNRTPTRDSSLKNGGDPPFSDRNRETWRRRHV